MRGARVGLKAGARLLASAGGEASWAAALEQAREERETGCAREKGSCHARG